VVIVLHGGGIHYWTAAVAKDERQGAGWKCERKI